MLEFFALAQECAPTVAPQTMAAIVNVESGFNPYAIGVVGGRLARQPTSREEALATVSSLAAEGWNFSVGVAQVNRHNLPKYNVTYEQAFDPCTNLRISSKILEDCYTRAVKRTPEPQTALHAAFSCYYSGNFTRGFKADAVGRPSYVQKVMASADVTPKAIPVVPTVKSATPAIKPQRDKAAGEGTPMPAAKVTAAPEQSEPAPAAPPPDHAPVLVRRSAPAAQAPAPVQSAPASVRVEAVSPDSGNAIAAPVVTAPVSGTTPAAQERPRGASIVF
jgi:type IV secretion system protein VirB1